MMTPIPTNLVEVTIKLLSERSYKLTYSLIERETGIARGWISEFSRGAIIEPGHSKLVRLYNYLIANR